MAGLICDFRNRISHLQGMRAEIMPELMRRDPVRTPIEKSVHTAAVEFSTIPADKQILRLGVSYFQILPDCMDDLVIDEYDPLLIAFSSHQQFPCLKVNICQANADTLTDTQSGICKDLPQSHSFSFRYPQVPSGETPPHLSFLFPSGLQFPAGISAGPLP